MSLPFSKTCKSRVTLCSLSENTILPFFARHLFACALDFASRVMRIALSVMMTSPAAFPRLPLLAFFDLVAMFGSFCDNCRGPKNAAEYNTKFLDIPLRYKCWLELP